MPMAKRDSLEETNETYKKVIGLLKEKNVQINHPIVVNTDNIEKDYAWVSCNYMGTGVKIPISELDFNDFKDVDPEVFRHCATWTYVYNKKKNK